MKCHSKRLVSNGAAWRVASGLDRSSVASLRMRFIVGDLVLNVGRDMLLVARREMTERIGRRLVTVAQKTTRI